MEDKQKIKKYLKSYLTAKKYYDSDIEKSYEYFKQCIRLLDDIKKDAKLDSYADIIDETETECSKYITNTIYKHIDKPLAEKIEYVKDHELFNIIDSGDLSKLNTFKYGKTDFSIVNEYGQTPLHYAIHNGDTSFLKYAFKLGAYLDQTDKNGHTLLEYACLQKDPNMINFLLMNGANMKKHLEFREAKHYYNNGNQIDFLLLEKYILEYKKKSIKYLDWVFKYINPKEELDIEYFINNTRSKIYFEDLIKSLDSLLDSLNSEERDTYLTILREELDYNLSLKLGCPINKIEIILINLVPFIKYDYSLDIRWLLSNEIKYVILKILNNNSKINLKKLNDQLLEHLYYTYIKPNIIKEQVLQILVSQWISKIKV